MMEDDIIRYVECDCGNEAMQLWTIVDKWNSVQISILKPVNDRISFLQRFQQAWRVIITGRPYSDQITFRKDAMNTLIDHLVEARDTLNEDTVEEQSNE